MEEAKYSANVRANLRGYDVQITARSDGEDDLIELVVAMVENLDRIGAMPERRWENGKTNGNGHQEPAAAPKAAPAAAPTVKPEAKPQAAPAPMPVPKAEAKPVPKPAPAPKPAAKAPICAVCEAGKGKIELIQWADKTTGEMKQAWKCQTCNTWHREPR